MWFKARLPFVLKHTTSYYWFCFITGFNHLLLLHMGTLQGEYKLFLFISDLNCFFLCTFNTDLLKATFLLPVCIGFWVPCSAHHLASNQQHMLKYCAVSGDWYLTLVLPIFIVKNHRQSKQSHTSENAITVQNAHMWGKHT